MGSRRGRLGGLAACAAGSLAALLALAPAAGADHPGAADSFGAFNRFVDVRQSTMLAPPEPHPLTGVGENFEVVANVPIDPGTQGIAASDLELHGNHAFVGSYGEGMVVIDISNPLQPKRVGKFNCPGGQNDIQLSPDGRFAVMAIETKNNGCHRGEEGAVYLDVSNPANPVELDFIPTQIGAHNVTLNYPILYVDNYVNDYSKLEIFDLSKPEKGFAKKVGNLSYDGENSPHDLIVDHRPDGRDLGYAASITGHDVLDLTDPTKPKRLQRITDPGVSISHQAEPNFDRSLLLVTDEFAGGAAGPGCGKGGATTVGGEIPVTGPTGDAADLGALHFYGLKPDGTVSGVNGQPKISTFNIPAQANNDPEQGCTVHVFWQAPAENRLVTAWYGRGTRVVDFSNAAKAKQLGFFIPTGGDTWAAKPHNGYIFTGDIVRGMDVLRYTGEGGNRWPTTSGAAEVQRAEEQGAVAAPGPGSGTGTGTPQPPSGGPQPDPSFRLSGKPIRPTGSGIARVPVLCKNAIRCNGVLRLQVKRVRRNGAGRVRYLPLGREPFSLSASNRRQLIEVKLSDRARRLVRKRATTRARVVAYVRFGDSSVAAFRRSFKLQR